MNASSQRRGFTPIDLCAVIAMIGIVGALLLPAVNQGDEEARTHQCQLKIKQLGLALLNHENAYSHFPLVTSLATWQLEAAQTARPAETKRGPQQAGWSWIVRILPYLEEAKLYRAISIDSQGFTIATGPFTPSLVNGSAANQHASCVYLSMLVCPDWKGNANTHGQTTIDTTAGNPPTGAPEYAAVDSDQPGTGTDAHKGLVAPTNYKAIVGTHLADQRGNAAPWENGIMLMTARRGSTISAITDGTSKTMIVAETKECGYASWYDGTLNWVVTNNPNAAKAPGSDDNPNLPPWTNAQIGINVGYDPAVASSRPWLKGSMVGNKPQGNVNWGPSSDHPGGKVMHVFADDHVMAITDRCDAKTYLNLTTRAGNEHVDVNLIAGAAPDATPAAESK